jgi:hypothetical protein
VRAFLPRVVKQKVVVEKTLSLTVTSKERIVCFEVLQSTAGTVCNLEGFSVGHFVSTTAETGLHLTVHFFSTDESSSYVNAVQATPLTNFYKSELTLKNLTPKTYQENRVVKIGGRSWIYDRLLLWKKAALWTHRTAQICAFFSA